MVRPGEAKLSLAKRAFKSLKLNTNPTLKRNRSDTGLSRAFSDTPTTYTNYSVESTDELPLKLSKSSPVEEVSSKSTIEVVVTTISPSTTSDEPFKSLDEPVDSPPAYSSHSSIPASPDERFRDRQLTKARYETSVKKLHKALKTPRGKWESFRVPEFDDTLVDPIRQLRDQIDNTLSGPKSIEKKSFIEKGFRAMSPFAKNFLRIAKEGQSLPVLNPYGLLCGGLLLLLTVYSS
jgi:hypothetical protein